MVLIYFPRWFNVDKAFGLAIFCDCAQKQGFQTDCHHPILKAFIQYSDINTACPAPKNKHAVDGICSRKQVWSLIFSDSFYSTTYSESPFKHELLHSVLASVWLWKWVRGSIFLVSRRVSFHVTLSFQCNLSCERKKEEALCL